MRPTEPRTPSPEKAPWLLETVGVLLLVLNMFLSATLSGRSAPSASALFGAMLAPAFIGLIVVGVSSIFSGMRNRRSRAKIFLAAMLVVFLGNCGNLGSMARRGELNPPTAAPDPTPRTQGVG
jgi:hypothetical protein